MLFSWLFAPSFLILFSTLSKGYATVLGFSAVITGLSLVPSTATVVLTSTFATRRLLERLGVKRMLLIGLTSMGVGQVWLSLYDK